MLVTAAQVSRGVARSARMCEFRFGRMHADGVTSCRSVGRIAFPATAPPGLLMSITIVETSGLLAAWRNAWATPSAETNPPPEALAESMRRGTSVP